MVFKDIPTIRVGSLMLNFAGTRRRHSDSYAHGSDHDQNVSGSRSRGRPEGGRPRDGSRLWRRNRDDCFAMQWV